RPEVEPLVQLVAPFTPHIAEELWEQLGHSESVFDSGWPAFDPTLAVDDTFELVVQVNGRVRGRITLPTQTSEAEALLAARADSSLSRFIASEPSRVVFVPGRLLNVVV
ncbi:MAG: class I tRNA ligase family protein, partial [Gemmatimonadaceae bacterium]